MEMKKYKLSEICRIASSKRIFESEYVERGVPFIRGQEISDGSILDPKASFECYISQSRYEEIKEKYGKPNKGDILITAVGTIGNLCYLDKDIDFYFKDGNVIWFSEIISSCDGKFLFHFMKSSYFKEQLKYFMIGAVQKALTIDMLKKVEVPLPPLLTQQKIATVLSTLDNKIALNHRINAKLEAMAKRLYDYWFVQFDFPNEEGKPYKSSGGKMVWNEVLKREIPEGWEVKSINDISVSYRGVGYTAKDEKTEKDKNIILILRGNNISNNHIIYNGNTVYVDKSFVLEEQEIKKFDIIITMSSGSKEHVGKSAMFLFDSAHSYGAFCNKITPNKECQYFLENYLHSESFIKYIRHSCSGTGINNLTNEHFDNAKFSFPTESNLQLFNKKMKSIYDERAVVEKEIQKLTNLRDRLLPLLMNGQVEVGTNNSSEFCNAKLGKQATACDMNGQVEVEE